MPNLSKCDFPVSCPFSASRRLQQGFALSWACCIRLAATIPRPNLSHIQPNPASQKPEPTSLHGTQHKNRGSPEHNLIRCPLSAGRRLQRGFECVSRRVGLQRTPTWNPTDIEKYKVAARSLVTCVFLLLLVALSISFSVCRFLQGWRISR